MKKFHAIACMLVLAGLILTSPARAEEEGEGKAKPKSDFEYLEMKPLVLPIITEKGLTQQLSLVISLEVPYGTVDDIKPMQPKLADAYLSDLYGSLGANGDMMRGNIVDVVALKNRLTKDTAKVIGEDKFHDVLLQVVQQSDR